MEQESSPLLAGVLDHLSTDVGSGEIGSLEAFARAYVARIPPNGSTDAAQAAALIKSLYAFVKRTDRAINVRAFNPRLEEHGYHSEGTVLEVCAPDSPFLLDSVSAAVSRYGLEVVEVVHPVIGVDRTPDGVMTAVRHARHTTSRESVEHYELDRHLAEDDLPGLVEAVSEVLGYVRSVVEDFHPMLARLDRMIDLAGVTVGRYDADEIRQAIEFLRWLKEDNFIFLGYREYRLFDTPRGKAVQAVSGSGLGVLHEVGRSRIAEPTLLSDLPPELAERYLDGDLLTITKTNRQSPVHRPVRMDYIGIRVIGPEGATVGEARLLGLFTSKAYMEPAAETPIIRDKLASIVGAEDLIEGSHDHKALVELLEGFSKHDLFATASADLRATLTGLLAVKEYDKVNLFVRRDLLERSVHVLVALPRDRFNPRLRQQLQELILTTFQGRSIEYHLSLSEGDTAQVHFTVWVEGMSIPEVPYQELEAKVVALARSWSDRLTNELGQQVGKEDARRLSRIWGSRFPEYYVASTSIEVAAGDVQRLEELAASGRAHLVGIQNEPEYEQVDRTTRVTLYRADGKRPLNELLPALVDLGLVVVEEVPTRIAGAGDFFIHDFGVLGPGGLLIDVDDTADRVIRTLESVWGGGSQSDDLNRLVIVGGLSPFEVEIIRAYRTYWRRVTPVFTVAYVNDTLVRHAEITSMLVSLFGARFDPDREGEEVADLRERIAAALDAVPSLEEDRILRSFLSLIEATLRTNAYLENRQALAFKFRSADVPDVPLPHPVAEIFVISNEVEGIHLRGGPVARGGIRWSTRREDYRTEVLGLMKAQMTKNAVIVPTGAKGGFVLRRAPDAPEELRAEVKHQYEIFVGALLDVTDNLVGGEVVKPPEVRVHDGDDPYLVVAADKGTATFSDAANRLAMDRNFWLGDAFASGGSSGYDHKALGITARGAWQSLARHFRELDIDPTKDPFTVVGIGDMSGDVFGNGMLGSDRIRLVAAFDHRHVFIDPYPDPAASFAERRRLFELKRSSWDDYDGSLISDGGGVYSRSDKKVVLSPQAQEALGTDRQAVTPAGLIRIILAAPVDMLWNGGIGTYVKASTETHAEVGDRTNDPVRVDAVDLRCRVVVEGGNLGLTQAGRVEFALGGGRVNADFIDNSGGVDCSDREVNLKILLGMAERAGLLARSERDRLIEEVADDVVERILYDNFQQAQMISQEMDASVRRMSGYEELMANLESAGLLDRAVEGLPGSDEMIERARLRRGLTRPELSVLLAYAKRSTEQALMVSDLPDDPYLLVDMERYFPARVVERFGDLLAEHPLRRELVATMLANDVVNSQGVLFVSRLGEQTGASAHEIVAAYRVARDVSNAVENWEAIEGLFSSVSVERASTLMRTADRAVAALAHWYLGRTGSASIGELVERHRPGLAEIERVALDIGPESWQTNRAEFVARLEGEGVPPALAHRHGALPVVVYGPDVIEVAEDHGLGVAATLDVFLQVGRSFGLDRLTDLARAIQLDNRWQRWALWTVEEELLVVRRRAAERVLDLAEGRTGADAVEHFRKSRPSHTTRLSRFLDVFDFEGDRDVAPLMVALRQVRSALT